MLRLFKTGRLAHQHSPEKEQRLVLFAIGDDKNKQLRPGETAETQRDVGQDTAYDAIGAIRSSIKNSALVTTPEILANLPEKASMLDSAIASGTQELNDVIENIARNKGITIDAASDEEKEDVLHELLSKPQHALAVARIAESRLNRHEEVTEILFAKLRGIAAGKQSTDGSSIDIDQLKAAIEEIKRTPTADREELRKKVMKDLKLVDVFVNEADEVLALDVLVMVEDALKADFKRTSFMNAQKDAGNTKQTLETARNEHLATIVSQYEGTKEFLDATLQQEAEKLYGEYARTHDENAEQTNAEVMKSRGLTANGFVDAFQKSTQVAFDITRKNETETSRNMPRIGDKNYLTRAEGAINDLERAKKQLNATEKVKNDRNGYANEPVWLRDARAAEERNELLAYEIAGELNKLSGVFEAKARNRDSGAKEALAYIKQQQEMFDDFDANAGKTPSLDDRVEMRRIPYAKLARARDTLGMLERTPNLFARMEGAAKNQSGENTEAKREDLKQRLAVVFPPLFDHLTHDVCDVLDVKAQVVNRKTKIQASLASAADETNAAYAAKWISYSETEIAEFEKALKLLGKIYNDDAAIVRMDEADYAATGMDPNTNGFYDDATGTIVINAKHCDTNAKEAVTIEHERGHAVIDILSRKTNICPNIFSGLHQRLTAEAMRQGISLKDLMERQADKWHYRHDGKIDENDFLDELTVQYADHKNGRTKNADPDAQRLFGLFKDSAPENQNDEALELSGGAIAINGKKRAMAHQDDEQETNPDGSNKTVEQGRNHRLEIQKMEASIKRFNAFFEVYKERADDPGVPEIRKDIEDYYNKVHSDFEAGVDPTNLEPFLDQAAEWIKLLDEEIKRLDAENMDLANASASQVWNWRKLFSNVQWLSIGDMMTMFKEASEDIQRMWKRRGEAARSKVGKSLFGLIPQSVPYLGQLSREFQGREQSSEQEEVGVWEKRYEKIDSHRLLHEILPKVTNKDELKAITNLLTKRGRMDWNYTKYWEVLESISRFHMPHEACKRDILLRDMYLQKLTADIWKDKDIYEHWKNDNDSGISSGKSHNQATTDTLSATKGGLAGRLKYLLGKQILLKNHQPLPDEEEINPHLYEQILHYAMKNGKMSLEDKIFYLIQGVAHDMLNIDRMKALVGEQGEILNSFPFIDFFNGKTKPDVMSMAIKLGYTGALKPENETIEPDFRTSDFIMDEIANDEGARQRANKALKNAQNIDHEDWPGMVSIIDYNGIENAVSVYSGNQWKVSVQGQENIFVGYNSLMQYFAIRAKHARDKGQVMSFTDSDARRLAIALSAYKQFDNIVTEAATGGGNRPHLSWDQINNDVPVSGGTKTKNYRDRMNTFMKSVVDAVGITNVQVGAKTVAIDDYIGKDRDANKVATLDKETIFKTTSIFVGELQNKILANKGQIVEMLADMAVKDPKVDGFIPESVDYTFKNVSGVLWSKH